MTDDRKSYPAELPEIVRDELHAANGRCYGEFSGPDNQRIELWIAGEPTRPYAILAHCFGDGGFDLYRRIDEDGRTTAAAIEALKAYPVACPLT